MGTFSLDDAVVTFLAAGEMFETAEMATAISTVVAEIIAGGERILGSLSISYEGAGRVQRHWPP
jgi:hypothetical protein